jgi:glutamine amidotransferase
MHNKTLIIDYGMGNIASVKKALDFLDIPNIVSNTKEDIEKAQFLILPGVGSFKQGMENLNQLGLVELLSHEILFKKKPILGICLGMQLFAQNGTEPDNCNGLGWVEGNVVKMENNGLRIPHLGWNNVKFLSEKWQQFDDKDFYFIHSYHFEVKIKEKILATVKYGEEYVAAIQYENILATQFHPEKSQELGLNLIKHFYQFYA